MAAWITLTRDHLISALSNKEREDFGKTSTANPGDDRIPEILADLTAEIRGYIGSCSQNTLSAVETAIPSEFKAKAISVARWRLLISMPGYSPGDSRKLDFEKANSFFKDVAMCKIRPAPAPDAVPSEVPLQEPEHGVQIVSAPGLRTGRRRMNGL